MATAETQVFISYHRADVEAAEQVRAQLAAHGVATWMDRYDIPAGAYWPDEIDLGLNRAEFVVGLLSPDAVASRNVKNEWDWALQNGKSLILLMTRSCVVPHRYVSINFIDATGDKAQAALEHLTQTPGLRPTLPTSRLPRTRYALSGGVNVAWSEFGSGDIDIVFVPGFISHVEHHWKLPALATHLTRFGTHGRILKLDKRGTGMSDRTAGIPTFEERMDDIRAVMDAAGSDRAVIYGLSEGVPLSILFAATYPERTQGLMLYGGSATYVTQSDYPWQKTLAEWQRVIAEHEATLSETWGTIESARAWLRHFAPSAVNDDAQVEWFAEFARLSASPGAVIALDRMNLEVDVRSILSAVHVPTLVFHRTGDHDADIGEARYIAERIPGAVFEELLGNDHLPWVGDQDSYFSSIERFLSRLDDVEVAPAAPEPILATVVYLAVADSDRSALLDDAAREVQRFRGQLVASAADTVLAVFDGPARAVRCAHAVLELGLRRGLMIRGGVQTGEVTVAGSAASGPAVEIATRLAKRASTQELLATGTVRDLIAGSGIRFDPAPQAQIEAMPGTASVLLVDRTSIA